MMLIDCGNTALKWQLWQAQKLQASGGFRYQSNSLQSLEHLLKEVAPGRCYITSVLDHSRQQLLEDCITQQNLPYVRFRSAASALGVSSAYADPDSLGDDRWLTLLAAAELAPAGSLIIDAGSAITLDLLSAEGTHLGGAIIPGTRTSRDHFRDIFSYLDLSELQANPERPPGCSTPDAIHIDYDRDSLDILLELLDAWQGLLPGNPKLILAGGDANRVESRLARPLVRIPDLVFRGMRRMIIEQG